jgi:hypothetical protein
MQYLVRIVKLKRAFWRAYSLTTARNVAGLKRERRAKNAKITCLASENRNA